MSIFWEVNWLVGFNWWDVFIFSLVRLLDEVKVEG